MSRAARRTRPELTAKLDNLSNAIGKFFNDEGRLLARPR